MLEKLLLERHWLKLSTNFPLFVYIYVNYSISGVNPTKTYFPVIKLKLAIYREQEWVWCQSEHDYEGLDLDQVFCAPFFQDENFFVCTNLTSKPIMTSFFFKTGYPTNPHRPEGIVQSSTQELCQREETRGARALVHLQGPGLTNRYKHVRIKKLDRFTSYSYTTLEVPSFLKSTRLISFYEICNSLSSFSPTGSKSEARSKVGRNYGAS